MRYMVMLSMKSDVGPPPNDLVEAMDVALNEAVGSGMLIDAGGLMGDQTTTFELRAGALSRVDGPFAEAKEVAGGFSLFEVRSPDEAIELGRRMIQLHEELWPGQDVAVEDAAAVRSADPG